MTKEIPLTQGQVAIVDDWWYEYLTQWKWFAWWDKSANSFYAVRNTGKSPHQGKIWMHRIVAKTPSDLFCDHIYHNTLDNREENLRNVTKSQNNINRRIARNNKTGVPGICKRADNGKYVVQLNLGGKRVFYKTFSNLEDAISTRKEMEKMRFGEFALK